MQMFQGGNAPAAVKLPSVPSVPEVKKPGEPLKLPSFGIDAGTIALPGEATGPPNAISLFLTRLMVSCTGPNWRIAEQCTVKADGTRGL